jgi:hypothetical protein
MPHFEQNELSRNSRAQAISPASTLKKWSCILTVELSGGQMCINRQSRIEKGNPGLKWKCIA